MKNIKAFTLVEFAVVITIMGLLIGGTLAGIEIIRNSKVAATIAQIDSYNAAVNAFYKTYGSLPGDMLDADKRLPNCEADLNFNGCELQKVGGMMTTYKCNDNDGDTDYLETTNKCNQCSATGVFPCSFTIIKFYTSKTLCEKTTSSGCAQQGMGDGTCVATGVNTNYSCTYTSDEPVESRDDIYLPPTTTSTVAYGQVEDGAVGPVSWDMRTYQGQFIIGSTLTADKVIDAETMLFWYELQQAGIMSGVTDAALRKDNVSSTFGKTHPFAELGGGFWAAYSDGVDGEFNSGDNVHTGRPEGAGNFTLNGNILVLVKYPTGGKTATGKKTIWTCLGVPAICGAKSSFVYMLNDFWNDNVINPKEAAYIDRKLDDGFPHTGTIQAYGNKDYCYKPEGSGYVYDEAITTKSCGLYIKIRE